MILEGEGSVMGGQFFQRGVRIFSENEESQ